MQSAPLVISVEEFLCHAEGPTIAPWNVQRFEDYIDDIDKIPDPGSRQALQGEYTLACSTDAALLLHREHVVGYYSPPGAVCIRGDHQGKGLGAELILYTALNLTGGPPTEGLDEQCFSQAGWCAHIAAWRLGIQRGLIINPKSHPKP